MATLREGLTRAWGMLTRNRHRDRARLDDELAFHREMLEGELRRAGQGPEAAHREAAQRLGGRAQIAESYGDQRTLPALESFLQDICYAVRTYRHAPAFTVAAVLTLSLGIGATTAIVGIVNAVLIRPLPFPDAGRLVLFGDTAEGDSYGNIGYGTFTEFRDRNRAFEQLAAVRSWQATLVAGEAEHLTGMRVSWSYFSLLGVQPALGRTFRQEDDHPDRYRVLVLSDGLWRRRFNADPSVIGRTIRMNDQSFEIIGVMPAGFEDVISASAYQPAELWAALGYDPALSYACRRCRQLRAVGRLRPGVTIEQAAEDLDALRAGLMRQYPGDYGEGRAGLKPLQDAVSGPVREPLFVLLAAVGFVLLIACANVANLLLARTLTRTREMAVRAALGAGRGRLVRQLVTESVLLWVAGGVGGLAVGAAVLQGLIQLFPGELPVASQIAIDLPVLGFSALLSVLTGLVFGLLPALSASSSRMSGALASGTRGAVGSSSRRTRQALVIADLAVALVLLVGAGLMLKSVSRLLQVNPGFVSEGVLTAQFSLVGEKYRQDPAVYAFMQRLIARATALPGVQGAAIAGQIPMGGNGDRFGLHIQGMEPPNPGDAPSPERYSVTPDYFRVMGIPLRRGRLIEERDTATSEPVILMSDTAANNLFRGLDPIGRRVRVGGAKDGPWRTIIGVVGDVRHEALTEPAYPQMYLPQSQFTDSFLVLTVKTSSAGAQGLMPAIRAALRELDPAVPLYSVAALDDLLAKSTAQRRFLTQLVAGFAAASLLLAAIGLYGVISYTVAARTREVGLRVALGASRADVLRLVLGSGAGTVMIGIALGLLASAAATRFLRGQLFEVDTLDPLTIASAIAVLGAVAVAAHLPPIRRALRVDPTIALRDD